MDVCLPVILRVSGSEILPAEYMRILSQKKVFRTDIENQMSGNKNLENCLDCSLLCSSK